MINLRKFIKYGSYAIAPIAWYYLGRHDRETVKRQMFNRGLNLSQRFKKYPAWDNYAEPLIINQASIIFTAGNSFIKGMISDNENSKEIIESIDIYKKDIEQDLKELKE